jgi:hypothetical protein
MQNFTFLSEDGLRNVPVFNPPGDGTCFFHCVIEYCRKQKIQDERTSHDLRMFLCNELERRKDDTIPGLNLTPLQYFDSVYAPRVENRESLFNLSYNTRIAEEGKTLSQKPLYVDCFGQYIEVMKHHKTYADNLIVAMSAHVLGLNLRVYTQSLTQVQETSDLPGVQDLISMGFRKLDAEDALKQTNWNFLDALDKLTSKTPGQSEEQPDVWRAQFYNTEETRHLDCVQLLNTGDHFMLILSEEAGEGRRRICLPEVPDCLLTEEPVQHRPSSSFGYTQFESSHLITCPDEFFDKCKSEIVAKFFPNSVTVHVQFNSVYAEINNVYLFSSLEFVEHDSVKYRVVSFTMENGAQVSYHGCIENLSKGSEKKAFFNQLYQAIQHQNVVSVRLVRLE